VYGGKHSLEGSKKSAQYLGGARAEGGRVNGRRKGIKVRICLQTTRMLVNEGGLTGSTLYGEERGREITKGGGGEKRALDGRRSHRNKYRGLIS